MSAKKPKAQAGDVVQLREGHRWAGALAIVEEVRAWGVVAGIPMPKGDAVGSAPIRLDWGDFDRIGRAALVLDGDA